MPPRSFDPSDPELMDRPQPVSAELAHDLDNLASLNRWFGSHRLLRRFLRRWWRPGDSVRVLDLCTGAGDLPLVMAKYARRHQVTAQITGIDFNPATIELARQRCADDPEITFIESNALTFSPSAAAHVNPPYDLVHCSLALHHFSEADAMTLLRRARTLGRRVLISDLERAWHTSLGVWLLTTLIYRAPMTVHDARVSARRAFSFREFRALAEQAGWQDFHHARFLFCRQAMWME
jgi:SAM-dependent methyltransferase